MFEIAFTYEIEKQKIFIGAGLMSFIVIKSHSWSLKHLTWIMIGLKLTILEKE